MSLWEHFDHSELNPPRDGVEKHLLHLYMSIYSMIPGQDTAAARSMQRHDPPWATCLLLVRVEDSRSVLDTGGLPGHTTVEDILELELHSCELPRGYWELNPDPPRQE